MIRVLVRTAICVVLLGRSAGADEPPARARATGEQLVTDGTRDYDAGRYDEAIAKLERAYALTRERSILYALGQAKRKRGDCRGAIETFDQFIALAPAAQAVGAARFQIARCLEQLAEKAPAATAAPERASVETPAPAALRSAAPAASGDRRWYKDPAGGALFGAGVAVAVAGAALLVTGEVQAGRATDDLQSFRDAQGVATLRTVGIVLSSAGVVLVAAGVTRWALKARRVRAGDAAPRGSVTP